MPQVSLSVDSMNSIQHNRWYMVSMNRSLKALWVYSNFYPGSPILMEASPHLMRMLNRYYEMGSPLREELTETYRNQLGRDLN